MRVLKGCLISLSLTFLTLILFISLTVFGLAFTLDRTVLNAGFVTSEINKVDAATLAEGLSNQQSTDELSAELKSVMTEVISRLQPLLKERMGDVIRPVISYVSGSSQSLDMASVLRDNVLNSDFVSSVWDRLDVPTLLSGIDTSQLVKEIVGDNSFDELPQNAKYLLPYADDIIINLNPWIKEQLTTYADPIFDYLLGRTSTLNVDVSLSPLKSNLENTLKTDFFNSPPSDLSGMSQAALEQYYNENYAGLADNLPATLHIDQSTFGADSQANINKALSDAENPLKQARQYVGYFELGFKLLIVLMILLILGIILIYHRVRAASRHLGIVFLVYAIPEYVGIIVGQNIIKAQLAHQQIAAQVQKIMSKSLSDFMSPLSILCICLIVLGLALLVLSFFYRKGKATS